MTPFICWTCPQCGVVFEWPNLFNSVHCDGCGYEAQHVEEMMTKQELQLDLIEDALTHTLGILPNMEVTEKTILIRKRIIQFTQAALETLYEFKEAQ